MDAPNGTGSSPFTVFAPTNDAFGALLNELGFDALADVPQYTLELTLNSHVIPGNNFRAADLTNSTVQSLQADLSINPSDVTVTDPNGRVSNIIVTDVLTANGVINEVD